uniref:Major facilitator superfamily domain containing 2A n=1 Tax=Vombatus ursinus TaxID=29139 RepID=A0A4X2LEF7_VOMUR
MQPACQTDANPGEPDSGGRKLEGQGKSWLPTSRKICYALGEAPYQLTGNTISFFLQIFLLDVVQLDPFWASSVIFLGRAWDSVSDPIVGFLVSRSPRRKCGKLIPWVLGSTPFGVLLYCLLWFTPSDTLPTSWKFFWHLTTYCFFQTCLSCYHVPYTSMTMFLGGSQRDRDSATAYTNGLPDSSHGHWVPLLLLLCGPCPWGEGAARWPRESSPSSAPMPLVSLGPSSTWCSSYWSMLPDAMDDFQLKYPSCQNLEAFFYSFYIFVNKFGGGLALGISTVSLHFAGYQAGDCEPNPMVKLILRVLMAPVPITLLIIGLTIFCFYPIDEEKRKEIRAKMEAAKDPLCQQL